MAEAQAARAKTRRSPRSSSSCPDGYDTVVGERGVQLSGGQKQRVALARALLAGPRVLVLDDPLSAVDSRTERAILDVIEKQRARRSVVLVTHRVAAAARCDKVFVLDRGRIVEEGTHEQLICGGGLYASFAEEQRVESELEALGHGRAPVAEARVGMTQAVRSGKEPRAKATRTEKALKAFHEEGAFGNAVDARLARGSGRSSGPTRPCCGSPSDSAW